jgi:hypothetical protein
MFINNLINSNYVVFSILFLNRLYFIKTKQLMFKYSGNKRFEYVVVALYSAGKTAHTTYEGKST